jgi:hypothetical protein
MRATKGLHPMIKRSRLAVAGAIVLAGSAFGILGTPTADAAPLPDNCTKTQGTVTCSTFEGPGNNQAGVGETTVVETQGNTKNKSPEPQDLEDTESCNPPSSQGRPCNP